MARGDKFNFYLVDAAGSYYTATQGATGWTVNAPVASADPLADGLYLKHLPKDWQNTEIKYERNHTYFGVFRSLSTNYQFTLDGRAVLLALYSVLNTQAFCTLRIDVLHEEDNAATPADVWRYSTFYSSQIDFGELKDDKKEQILTVSQLDSKLFSLIKANANKNYNIPFWDFAPPSTWTAASGTEFMYTKGCKLLWGTNYISGATSTSPIAPPFAGQLYGFNHGSVSDGRHWIPNMNQYNIVQNNGTTTYIGNDVLQPFLIQQNQAFNYNRNFEGVDDIQAYTQNRGLIKNLLKNPQDTDVVAMNITISGDFDGNIVYPNGTVYINEFIRFVLFEIDNKDKCTTSGGNYTYITLYTENLPASGSPFTPSGAFTATTHVDMKYDHTYIMGVIYDDVVTGVSGQSATLSLSNLELKIESDFSSGTATPVSAPRFPYSTFPVLRAPQVLKKIMAAIDSTDTDAYGFPSGGGAYVYVSDYLDDVGGVRANDYDLKAYNLMFTSENALRQIQGQPYLSISLNDFFSTMFKVSGVGLGMIGGVAVRIEKLLFFFDAFTQIYDLGANVSGFTIEPLVDLKTDNIKAGYSPTQTNNNFGVDSFLMPQEYATKNVNTPKELNLAATSVIVDQNQIEKARAQNNTRQKSSPSANNGIIVIDAADTSIGTVNVSDPSGANHFVDPWDVQLYPTAQSTDPTAATAPYVNGLYYPETAMNLSLTPASNMRRLMPLLSAICYGTDKLTFRKQYQMLYNNAVDERPSIAKKLTSGLIKEVADIPLAADAKLFRPELFTVTTKTPVNFYSIVNSNPYGYVSFTWINPHTGVRTEYKGFIWEISQKIGDNDATTIKLLAHPDTTDADIAAA